MKLKIKYMTDVIHSQAYGCLLFVQIGYRALFVGTGFSRGLYLAFKPPEASEPRRVIKLWHHDRSPSRV